MELILRHDNLILAADDVLEENNVGLVTQAQLALTF
jgi:hypothetical protein